MINKIRQIGSLNQMKVSDLHTSIAVLIVL